MDKMIMNNVMSLTVDFKNSSCSLLIPNEYMTFFKRRVHLFGGIPKYFEYLINQYRMQYQGNMENKSMADRIQYQSGEAPYHKISFRPIEGNWYEFGMIAQLWNMSRCLLFAMLLKMDYAGMGAILRKKFNYSIAAINRFCRKRVYFVKAYFPFRNKPRGMIVNLRNMKV